MRDLFWALGLWFYFGTTAIVFILFAAERPLPKSTYKDWLSVIALGPVSWFLIVYYGFKNTKL